MSSEQVSTGHTYSNLTETGLFLKKLVSFDHKSGRQLRKSRCGRPAEVFLFPVSLDRRLLARKVELSNDPGKTVRVLGLSGIFFYRWQYRCQQFDHSGGLLAMMAANMQQHS